ncbi:transposase [Chryseobacterium phosphatilyticum]|uniref:Transposase n=1 Tax=Chryseobacterium phosphatilyticum TaxID=475075 RepID=A0A316XD21_9FLAO|nr:helix-turn-helix domain-containing protein [Chryseobacterium phosphatilyticum]PWN69218.1 transposase [Chryseobacterium phosphatilyticum]
MNNFKDIHMGQMIEKEVVERGIEISYLCKFLKCIEADITEMYQCKSLDSEILLSWSKILQYDLFRIYSQHLIFYSPLSRNNLLPVKTTLPQFRKNIYSKEVIDFILELYHTKQMTRMEIIEHYGIPRAAIQRWIYKY